MIFCPLKNIIKKMLPYINMHRCFVRGEGKHLIKGELDFEVCLSNQFSPIYHLSLFYACCDSDVFRCNIAKGEDAEEVYNLNKIETPDPPSIKVTMRGKGVYNLKIYERNQTLNGSNKFLMPLPVLVIYTPAKTMYDGENEATGKIFLGSCVLRDVGEYRIENYHMELEKELGNALAFTDLIGTVKVSVNYLDLSPVLYSKTFPRSTMSIFDEFAIDEIKNIFIEDDVVCAGVRSVFQETRIGKNTGTCPRVLFYANVLNNIKVNDEWLEALFYFTFWFFGVDPMAHKLETTKDISYITSMYVLSLTLFITRIPYQYDTLQTFNPLTQRSMEIFSQDLLSIGAGDCEDFSFPLLGFFTYIKRREAQTSPSYPLLNQFTSLLKNYIPAATLVKARASILSSNGFKNMQRMRVPISYQNESLVQQEDGFFHMVTVLYPNSLFTKEKAEGEGGLYPLFAEGTCSVYPNVFEKYETEEEEEDLILKNAERIIYSGNDIGILFTDFTYEKAPNMYVCLYEACMDHFLATENQLAFIFETQCENEILGARPENLFKNEVRLRPLVMDNKALINTTEFQLQEAFEHPKPILHIDKENMKKLMGTLDRERIRPLGRNLLTSFYFSSVAEPSGPKEVVYPYLPWNLTDAIDGVQQVEPIYLHVLL